MVAVIQSPLCEDLTWVDVDREGITMVLASQKDIVRQKASGYGPRGDPSRCKDRPWRPQDDATNPVHTETEDIVIQLVPRILHILVWGQINRRL